tara:strand:- start:309 stop:1229 length:921 start_codon:yes stop_codon:yes gene_type:complete
MLVGFQIDAIETLNLLTDSSMALIYESQVRKNRNFVYQPSTLTFKNNSVYAIGQEIDFKSNKFDSYQLSNLKEINLSKFDIIFIRQDPPFNMEYITSMYLLELLSSKVRFINNPVGIRNAPEKILMLQFSRLIPPTIITRSIDEVKKFTKKFRKAVIKPIYGNGGEGIFFLEDKDKNFNQIIEGFISKNSEPFIVQKFLPEIKKGDKRIILVDGDPVAAIRRVPEKNEIRSNIHVGGKCKPIKLNQRDLHICNEIKNILQENKLFFVGIDIIGNYLTEINVTSPTCIQEIKKINKIDVAKIIWDRV